VISLGVIKPADSIRMWLLRNCSPPTRYRDAPRAASECRAYPRRCEKTTKTKQVDGPSQANGKPNSDMFKTRTLKMTMR
jgi:hypothetical protein